ncbi:MAG: beta-galactosidase, partial [Myxococcales bacterium]|nr:beta-galactosidase [Myxococcales bacterium]
MARIVAPSEATGPNNGRVGLCRSGLVIDGAIVPLLAGAVHYFRLDPGNWRACLEAVKQAGCRLVDLYVPWNEHEVAPGKLDFGLADPRHDVGGFLDLVQELGLYAILRPGPHVNAELSNFGIPERVVWDPACQARGPSGSPVVLPVVPRMFPVPSYASDAYHDEVRRYFGLLGAELASRIYPRGPIVLLQIDNEGALFFRDGAYDQDYHPDALRAYRDYLRERYGTIDALREVYRGPLRQAPGDDGEAALSFTNILPPDRFRATARDELAYYLDWAAFQEHLLATSLGRFARALDAAGLGGIPTAHNFPLADNTTPLNAARVGEVVDFVGHDFYHRASGEARTRIAARASASAQRAEVLDVPAFACEVGAGYPAYFPRLSERDSMFTVLTALAYGVRGFNIYMAIQRDRWIGAPYDERGRARPFASFWERLLAAFERTRFHELSRATPVRLLVPRVERRLARVMHALGPATAALMTVMGQGPRESCFEDELGEGYPLALQADDFGRAFEQALSLRGVPYAVVGGEDRDVAFAGARWVICATTGGFADALAERLAQAAAAGTRITLGPRPRKWDGQLQSLDGDRLAGVAVEEVASSGIAEADAAVGRAI